jgi:hypothetical protein
MHSNVVLFSITLLILVSIFLPTQVFAKYYSGLCPEYGLTESQARDTVTSMEFIFGNNIKAEAFEDWGIPLDPKLPTPSHGDAFEYKTAVSCSFYFKPDDSGLLHFNGWAETGDDTCPGIGGTREQAIGVRSFQTRQMDENHMKAGQNKYIDIGLDRITQDIQVMSECIAYFDQRDQDLETLEDLVPEDIRKPFEESIDPEDLKEIYDKECIIATASFGSPMAKEVQMLREIRDNQLLQTQSGSAFMSGFNTVYYSFAPTIANWENENLVFKEIVRTTITPLITSLSILNYVEMDSEAEVLGYGISLILLNVGMYFGVPAMVIVGIRKRF